MFNDYVDEGKWDFRGDDTKEYTHCFHIYPAMMIPQIARRLIELYGEKGDFLFDPYCGTGTSLVEGRLAGMSVAGTDLNPTARLISLAKSDDYDRATYSLDGTVHKFVEGLEQELAELSEDFSSFPEPANVTFERLEDWFPNLSIAEVSFCLEKIKSLETSTINRNFLLVALSECLRLISFQRNGEFKLYRIKESQRPQHYVPLYGLLKNRIDRNVKGVRKFMSKTTDGTSSEIHSFNTVEENGKILLKRRPNIVITSPPYGDSGTTVAYAQFSWLTNVWFGLDSRSPGALDRELMGGRRSEIKSFGFEPMDTAIAAIANEDEKRASEVVNFFSEYLASINNVADLVLPEGHVCYVVGNRTVKGVQLPTDQFTAWAFVNAGFEYVTTHIREIPNKRMPSRNSPTNIAGKTSKTMHNEYIVVLRKKTT